MSYWVYLGYPIAPSHMSPNAGGGGGFGCTREPKNKLWRSNSVGTVVIYGHFGKRNSYMSSSSQNDHISLYHYLTPYLTYDYYIQMPANYTYRKTTETLVMERTNIIKQANTIAEAEVKIGAGCIEEVIVQVLFFKLKF
jgi:hypothetical protein